MDMREEIQISGGWLKMPEVVESLETVEQILRSRPVEDDADGEAEGAQPTPQAEWAITYLNGPLEEFFNALELDADSLILWFQTLRLLKQQKRAALYYWRVYRQRSLPEALERIKQVDMLAGERADVLEELHELRGDLEQIPEPYVHYIDWERMANDWVKEGRLFTFFYEGVEWVVLNQPETEA
uniref:Uncharacterized protein n=1 Tax=Magnetococcus massalia (strain MO-1) TaxID=451514 RepID=A0A1S7LJV6_MAGMO|nr:conserved protein of unknown function [Candidatus Magnetococcus massalia]